MYAERHAVLRETGRLVALLHDGGMVHGDLTTSNMLLRAADKSLVSRATCGCYHAGKGILGVQPPASVSAAGMEGFQMNVDGASCCRCS